MFVVLVLDYPPPYFATVSLISIWSTLYVSLMKPKRFASLDVSSNQRGLQQIRSLLTISLRASMDRVCGLSLLQIRLHAQQIQIQMLSKYKYKCSANTNTNAQHIRIQMHSNVTLLRSMPWALWNFYHPTLVWSKYFQIIIPTPLLDVLLRQLFHFCSHNNARGILWQGSYPHHQWRLMNTYAQMQIQ